ncbi:binding-protein-dependent transport system inner membrane protein [Actinomadura verrucosospora]|uniref:Binding-protein-dependent transport system inner membrane protein n=1 Tax=Actinomadura verrucosospora TaxID=46165 RepID=A0A7D3VQ47_ACTVE|nr:binding-protein-dependent transport system inner membrane protein [Actinomadura verrucosospora]
MPDRGRAVVTVALPWPLSATSRMSRFVASTESLPWWMAVALFGVSIVALLGHLSFKCGTRIAVNWVRYNYFNRFLPPLIREAPLNLLLGSATFALWGCIVVLSHFPKNQIFDYIIAVLAIASMIPPAVYVKRWLTGYPDRLKPQWLLEEERRHKVSK